MKTRFLSLALALLMCMPLVPTAALDAPVSAPAAEVLPTPESVAAHTPSSWAQADVAEAIGAGLVPYTLQSDYTRAITRAEFAALAVTLLETVGGRAIEVGGNPFTDTDDRNAIKAAAVGVTTGTTATTFSPNDALTREQAATMLARLADAVGRPLQAQTATFRDTAQIAPWAEDAVGKMQASGVMGGTGDNLFSPQGTYTREQSILTALRLFRFVGGVPAADPALEPVLPSGVMLDTFSLALTVGETHRLSANVTPSDAEDKAVSWSSSRTSVATVSSTGTVTAVAIGSTTITAQTVNGITATCTVTVTEAVKAPLFTVPALDHEYGPFTLTSYYSSGKVMNYNSVSSLVFTKIETAATPGKYHVYINIEGITDYRSCWMKVYFYNASGRVIGEETIIKSVAANQPYNILTDHIWNTSSLDNAVRLEFYSHDGHVATYGADGGGSDPGNTNPPKEDPPEDQPPAEPPSADDYAILPGVPDFEKFVSAPRMNYTYDNTGYHASNADIMLSATYSLPDGDYLPIIQPYLDELERRGFSEMAGPTATMDFKKETAVGTLYVTISPTKTPGDNYLLQVVGKLYLD